MQNRSTLFISHANPADNDFAAWLGSRLTAMGYRAWADLRDVKGGTKHWEEIERTIREDAAKVLIVTSRSSRSAEGVDNEIQIAKGVEKDNELNEFIIQLKIDDLPYSQLPPPLNNRIAITFFPNWGAGLRQLVEQLDEEGIPRDGCTEDNIQVFSTVLKQGSDTVIDGNEPAYASWLPIRSPDNLAVYSFPGSAATVETRLCDFGVAAAAFRDTVISYADKETVSYALGMPTANLKTAQSTTHEWTRGGADSGFQIPVQQRTATWNKLINATWSIELQNRGFVRKTIGNDDAYYLSKGKDDVIKQPYNDPLGRKTRPVYLMGYSNKWDAFWHAAISAKSRLHPIPHFSVRLHVAFTRDGTAVIGTAERAFQMRKRFCKNFWNDRWRRILFALVTRLADSHDTIRLATGGQTPVELDFPLQLEVPYQIGRDPVSSTSVDIDEFSEFDPIGEVDRSVNDDEDSEEAEDSIDH